MSSASEVRVGISGHLDLTSRTCDLVASEIRDYLVCLGDPADLVGVTCLAPGADTVFALQLVAVGSRLEVIIPSPDYLDSQIPPEDTLAYRTLVRNAWSVRRMPALHADEEAYAAANKAMLDSIDRLLAVWDGRPNGGVGGTAAVVRDARTRGIPVTVIWPAGAGRLSDEP